MRRIGDFFQKYRFWITILIVFLAIRIFIFATFWQASEQKGGWENFYGVTQSAKFVLLGQFHEPCDWHPPLYYFLTSVFLSLFKSQFSIYIFQVFLAFVSLFFIYKIARLFFSEKIARWSVFFLAIEPFWAWNNFLLVSENLATPLFLAGLYFLFKFLFFSTPPQMRRGQGEVLIISENTTPPQSSPQLRGGGIAFFVIQKKDIFLSAFFFGLATLTRANTLLLVPGLAVLVLILWLFRSRLEIFSGISGKYLIFSLLLFNILFFSALAPWAIRNKIVYGRLTIANILSTNTYFYNLTPLIALEKNISQNKAQAIVYKNAENSLGKNVGDQGDCTLFSKIEFNKQLDFFKSQSQKYILARLPLYLKIHLVKAIPFFFQPGYMDMWTAWTGDTSKPDLTFLFLKNDFGALWDFFAKFDFKMFVFFGGILFWGICSAAIFLSLLFSYFKDKKAFIFFAISAAVIIYSAVLVSPFVLARYRLPLYGLFFIAVAYVFTILLKKLKSKSA